MSSNSIGVLQKLHDELRDVPDPLKNWKQVSSIFAGIEVVLATEYSTHVQQFQKLVTVTFSTRRGYSVSLGDGNTYDERDRSAKENLRINESIAKTTVEKVVKFVETIISLSLTAR